MKINIILPYLAEAPEEQSEIMYLFANELDTKKHKVSIYHFMHTSGTDKLAQRFSQHLLRHKRYRKPTWFKLHDRIISSEIVDISNDLIEDATFIISTGYETSFKVFALDAAKGIKIDFIQQFENAKASHPEVFDSYRLPVLHVVTSNYLKSIVESYATDIPSVIPISIVPAEFSITTKIQERSPFNIITFYSENDGDDFEYKMMALDLAFRNCPRLQVSLVGTIQNPLRPFPSYVTYYYNPSDLAELYNQCAVFIAPDLADGSETIIAEAMACGCACICNEIIEHSELVMKNKTALLVPKANVEQFAQHITELTSDTNLRIRIASSANENVKQQGVKRAIKPLETVFNSSLNYVQRLQTIDFHV